MNRQIQILDNLRPGDILNMDTKPKWYEFWLKIVYGQIRYWQKRKWGKHSRYTDIHSMLHLGNGRFFSFEAPFAIYRTLFLTQNVYDLFGSKTRRFVKRLVIDDRTKYRICRLKDTSGSYYEFDDAEMQVMADAAKQLIGKRYDYGQLLDILLKQVFKKYVSKKLSIFDLGRKRKVCSVAVHWILVKWWKQFTRQIMSRPLYMQHVENTCPADFANHNHFGIVTEL